MGNFIRAALFLTGILLLPAFHSGKEEAQEIVPVAEAEAEDGVLSGVTVQTTHSGYSGTGYVANFANDSDQVTMTITLPDSGLFRLMVQYGGFWGYKVQNIIVNGNPGSNVEFPASDAFTSVYAGTYYFSKGDNTVSITKNWGYMAVDKIWISEAGVNTFDIDPDLVDPGADKNANRLFDFLKTQFGERIISGQTISYFDELSDLAGATPLLQVGDLSSYTEGYPYLWKDGGHTFGATDDGTVAHLIDWYNTTGGKGMVSLQWHWHSPSGGEPGNNNFYTSNTDFDVREAVTPGTEEYDLVIRDIDAVAEQLQRFEDAGVPVLWRPLHEAGGGWFWWGAHGPEPCLSLYDMLFERLMKYHQLHNLIWVWSTPEEDWYPGNHKVDIMGYDSYPGVNNYNAQRYWFDRLYELTGGEKLIAMTENGPIPDPDECFKMEAPWLFFMSWSDLVSEQNETTHLQKVFSHPSVITLESENSLWRSKLYPDDWFPGYQDEQGRFFHDFSYAGYHRGEDTIPFISKNTVDVTKAPYNVDNTGAEDVTVALQQALDDVGMAGGGVVYLPAGTYRIREASSTANANAALHMKYDSVILRGAGPDSTYILHDQAQLRQKDIVHIRKEWSNWSDSRGTETLIRNDLMQPTKVIPVESVSGFSVGDLVVVRNYMTTAFAADHFMDGIWDNTWLDGVMFLRKIDSIDVENRFLIIDIPTRYYLMIRDNAKVYHAGSHITECGIENLSFGNKDNYKSSWGDLDYTVSGTGAYDVHASHVIHLKYAQDCWVRNVHTFKPEGNTEDVHILSNCLVINMCRNITVDSCDFQKPQYEGGGGNGYMYTLNGNDCLVQNSRANHSRHNFDFKFTHSNGNVIYNCRGENSRYSSDFHMYLSMANLIDGFTVDGDYLECAFRPYGGDVIHGYPSTQSVFYNTYGENYHVSRDFIVDSRQFDVGYLIGTSGPADQVRTTPVTGIHDGYNYDTSPEDYVEGVGNGENLRPVSLYRDQLKKRMNGYGPLVNYYDVTVETRDALSGEAITGAEVVVNDSLQLTGESGSVFFSDIPVILEVNISAEGYDPVPVHTYIIYSDTVFRYALHPVEYDVEFHILDSRTGESFRGARVTFNGTYESTGDAGSVNFTAPAGMYDVLVEKLSYADYAGSVDISSDTLITIYLERTEAYMKFWLMDGTQPVNKAYVSIGSDSIETNNLGQALFDEMAIDTTYSYSVRKEGYEDVSGEVYLLTDTTINIAMITVNDTTNLSDFSMVDGVRVWPNPASSILFLETGAELRDPVIQILDIHGRIIFERRYKGVSMKVDLGGLTSGLFFLKINGNQLNKNILFIKE
ncbi:MAG: T9SS type A sorting domain-containing protein [Bacteroidales bacterium]|nr:T9SS type A sorting domain-containing protein [Bacteroidales bacterium]